MVGESEGVNDEIAAVKVPLTERDALAVRKEERGPSLTE